MNITFSFDLLLFCVLFVIVHCMFVNISCILNNCFVHCLLLFNAWLALILIDIRFHIMYSIEIFFIMKLKLFSRLFWIDLHKETSYRGFIL